MSNTPKEDSFAAEYRDTAQKQGGFKNLGDAVGMPDKEDWQNICRIISVTRKATTEKYGFDILVDCIADAKREHAAAGNKYGRLTSEFMLVNKDSNMRHVMELPQDYVYAIEKAYPLMFSNKKHFAWFCKNFKELLIAEKY